MKIFLNGTGGLGNVLFQISTAIYYKEKYLQYDEICLNDNSSHLHIGTSNYTNRDKRRKKNGEIISYKKSIFSKLNYVNFDELNINYNIVHNDFSDYKYLNLNKNILISGYNQNYNLFYEVLNKIPNYLNLEDPNIINYIKNKYSELFDNQIKIMIGVRLCDDFIHMKNIREQSYYNALELLINKFNLYPKLNIASNTYSESNYKIVIITDDIERCKNFLNFLPKENVYFIDEDDIVQIYIGLLCDKFILSESTYHYWIALLKYIKDKSSTVICFNNTDITNRNLALPEWEKINL